MAIRTPSSIYRGGCVGLAQRLSLAWRFHGPFGIAAGMIARSLKLVRGPKSLQQSLQRYKEFSFDARFMVTTFEEVAIDRLGIPADKERNAVEYSPTSPVWFVHLISGLNLNYGDFTFVDLGSGKGRTLLLASEFPFKQVIGVEISERLHATAVKNISSYRPLSQKCHDIQSICEDATDFQFPETPLVVFLYNPFHLDVLQPVIENLRCSFEKNIRPVVVVYSNPLYRQLFAEAHWLEEVESASATWVVYQSPSTKGD